LSESLISDIETGDYVIKKGVFYEGIEEKDTITIRKTKPVGHILGVQLVEGIHKSTRKKVVVSNEDIFKIY
jgi:hypothetical protein